MFWFRDLFSRVLAREVLLMMMCDLQAQVVHTTVLIYSHCWKVFPHFLYSKSVLLQFVS